MFDLRSGSAGETPSGGGGLLDDSDGVFLPSQPEQADREVIARVLAVEAAQRADDAVVADLPPGSVGAILAHQARLARQAFSTEARARAGFAQGLRVVHELVASVLEHDKALYGCERSEAMGFAVHEVAAALGVNRRTADLRVDDAMLMVPNHERTLRVLEAGYLPVAAARELAHRLVGEPAALREAVEARVLDTLGARVDLPLGTGDLAELALTASLEPDRAMRISLGASRGRVRDLVRRTLRDLRRAFPDAPCAPSDPEPDPTGQPAEPGGDVEAWPSMRLGLVGVGAEVPEADGIAILGRLDQLARWSKRQGDPRSLAELRVAWYVTLLTSERASTAGLPGDLGLAPVPVHLTVHLVGDGDQTRLLVDSDQLGPTSQETLAAVVHAARESGGWVRVRPVVLPECPGHAVGLDAAVLDPGPYQLPPKLREAVRARDRTCRFPGCTVPARSCDLDHTIPHPRGPTCHCNLACLCRRHHRLKTSGRWRLVNHGAGRLTWISATGRICAVAPDPP